MAFPLPLPGVMAVIQVGAPLILHVLQFDVTVKAVLPAGDPIVMVTGDTVRMVLAPLCVTLMVFVRPHPLTTSVALRA